MPTPAVEATKHMIVWLGVCVAVTSALGVLVAFDKGKRVLSTGLPGRLRSTRAAALGTGTVGKGRRHRPGWSLMSLCKRHFPFSFCVMSHF